MSVEAAKIEIAVVLGTIQVPIRSLLKMGRGAVIMLDSKRDDPAHIHAGGVPIARASILVAGETISVQVTEMLMSSASALQLAQRGAVIG